MVFSNEVVEKKIFGSYVRGTILPRKVDEKSDVDIMIVFNNPYGYKPQTFLNKLKSLPKNITVVLKFTSLARRLY